MPSSDPRFDQKMFDSANKQATKFRRAFDDGECDLAILSRFAFPAVFRLISYARLSPVLQSRKTEEVFDHLFFVSDIPRQAQSNVVLRQAAYKASLYHLIQALFVYSNETARRPALLEKIQQLLNAYCADASLPRHPFFDRFRADFQAGALTDEQSTSYLALLYFACYFSAPLVRFEDERFFKESKEKRLVSLTLGDMDREVETVLVAHLQHVSSDTRDVFIDCFSQHLSDSTLPLHFVGQRLYNEGCGILNTEQKHKILARLIPAIEAVKQQNSDLKADKYSTIEEQPEDWGQFSSDEKRLLRLFRDLETYKTDFEELGRHISKAPSQIDLPRVPSEPGIEMVSLATILAGLFGYVASPTESSDDGVSDDESTPLYPEGLRQRAGRFAQS